MTRIGIVDVGGGMRASYGAAVFDHCLDMGISFDDLAGVSAGSANIASFLGKQKGRNLRFYADYAFRREYMSVSNMFKKGNYLDLEYIYGDALTNRNSEDPLNFENIADSGKNFMIIATDAETGQPVYYHKEDMAQDDYGAIKGSSCVPVAAQAYHWKGKYLYDGGLSDPIPYHLCFENGCDKVVVVLTRPESFRRDPKKDSLPAKLIQRKWPNAANAMRHRAEVYNRQLDALEELVKQGRALIIAPDDIGGMSTLSKDRAEIVAMYDKGYRDAEKIPAFLEK